MIAEEKKTDTLKGRKPLFLAGAAAVAVLAAAGLWYLRAHDPTNSASVFPPCLFHATTGLWCAGCGMTRALHDILNGRFYQGFRMNPLAISSSPFLLGLLGVTFYRLYKKKPLPRIPLWFPWAVVAVVVLYTVARNLPWEPFSWLAPTIVG